jgi:hypothetical protein
MTTASVVFIFITNCFLSNPPNPTSFPIQISFFGCRVLKILCLKFLQCNETSSIPLTKIMISS